MTNRRLAGSAHDERGEYRYQRVKAGITDWLAKGRWQRGQAIPSEPMLAHAFGASIGTVRHAIDQLVMEGILVRQHGRGTFVASHTKEYLFNVFFRIVDKDGQRQRSVPRLLSFRRAYASAVTAEQLKIARGAPIYRITKAIMFGDRTVAWDDIRLPAKLFPHLTSDDVGQRGTTVYGILQHRYGIDAVWAKEIISAVRAGQLTSRILKVRFDAPVLRIERTAYSYRGVPIDARYRYICTSNYRYLTTLGHAPYYLY